MRLRSRHGEQPRVLLVHEPRGFGAGQARGFQRLVLLLLGALRGSFGLVNGEIVVMNDGLLLSLALNLEECSAARGGER
ncbi:MAG TPA: hypothetical protein VL176_13665, partial [Steroidobacteraceae bacterium]|nr:hypothetical protein [Steroidobacteraceae bacterium]